MNRRIASAGLLATLVVVASCGGPSTTASSEPSQLSTQPQPAQTSQDQVSSETLPALLDPSTDIDAIDMPVVLWFWSPG